MPTMHTAISQPGRLYRNSMRGRAYQQPAARGTKNPECRWADLTGLNEPITTKGELHGPGHRGDHRQRRRRPHRTRGRRRRGTRPRRPGRGGHPPPLSAVLRSWGRSCGKLRRCWTSSQTRARSYSAHSKRVRVIDSRIGPTRRYRSRGWCLHDLGSRPLHLRGDGRSRARRRANRRPRRAGKRQKDF